MKKIFLTSFVLLLVGSATMAQEKSGKAAAVSTEKKATTKQTAVQGKSQTPAAKATTNESGRRQAAVPAAASLVEYNATKAN